MLAWGSLRLLLVCTRKASRGVGSWTFAAESQVCSKNLSAPLNGGAHPTENLGEGVAGENRCPGRSTRARFTDSPGLLRCPLSLLYFSVMGLFR